MKSMSEKILFYNLKTNLLHNDYFDLDLANGSKFVWKNFGQVVTIDGADITKENFNVDGAIIPKELLEKFEISGEWLVDAYEVGYGENENHITIGTTTDTIHIDLHLKYGTRNDAYPDDAYFYWVNEYPAFKEYVSMIGLTEDKAIDYLMNWRRPKLKTNAPVLMVVIHNNKPKYVAILDSEGRKSYVDAFFRLVYSLQFMAQGEQNVR